METCSVFVGFVVLTAVGTDVTVFWVVPPRSFKYYINMLWFQRIKIIFDRCTFYALLL